VVDDELIVRVGIRSVVNWEEYGYTIVADAAGGKEALEKIDLYGPDIVLTDLVMEDMDGFELIRRCAEKYPRIRFVVLSGYNDFDNVRRAMKLGARDYIFKPAARQDDILRVLDEVSADQDRERAGDQKLDRVIRENLSMIKYNLLRKWVNHSIAGEDDIAAQFGALALGIDILRPYFLLYISIDNFEEHRLSGEFKDVQVIKASVENTIGGIFSRNRPAEVFSYERGDTVVFINTGGEEENPEEDFFKIREYCKRYLGITVSGTISPAVEGAEKLPDLIRICKDTMSNRTSAAELYPYNGGQRNEIARAREYIAKNIGEHLGVGEIAAAVGMSESYFSHLFKKETGVNVVDYVNRLKMEKAAEILENSQLKIADAASLVGIDNPNYFSVLFKKINGVSPQEYRERCKTIKGGGTG
jgi:two-component system response regulator YesN